VNTTKEKGIVTAAFPVSERNKVRRLHERGRYDKDGVYAVLDAAMLCHIAYVIDGQPYCTPTAFWREGDHLYWHGSSASRMLRSQKPGLAVCLTVTHLDSLVLARCGFNHSVDYRSAMCFGTAHLIEDPAEKERALDSMVDRFYPGRAASLRTSTVQELKATTVIGRQSTKPPPRSAPRAWPTRRRTTACRSTPRAFRCARWWARSRPARACRGASNAPRGWRASRPAAASMR
jgi:nitroimidazol reductase NimA-like FMN-containing flavoprotein (pyridoxamine 5'-phosphate oxidase superfamily)